MEKIIPSISEIKSVNSVRFSEADYVNYISNSAKSPRDIIMSFMNLFFPEFSIRDGMAFNDSFGCYDLYSSNISKGMNEVDAYYWSHVVDVGGTFLVSDDDANIIADRMCVGWNLSLANIGFSGVKFLKQAADEVLVFPKVSSN